MEDQEFFDIRFICSTCNGERTVSAKTRHKHGKRRVPCRKCAATGMFATGNQLQQLIEELNALKAAAADENEFTHITEIKELVTVRTTPVGVEISSTTGDFLIIQGGNNMLAVAVKPRGAPRVEEWEISVQKGSEEE